jgi:hypothetical protein
MLSYYVVIAYHIFSRFIYLCDATARSVARYPPLFVVVPSLPFHTRCGS